MHNTETLSLEDRIANLERINARKRLAALEHLGPRWICHKDYMPIPRHALKDWEEHSILAPIAFSARVAGRLA